MDIERYVETVLTSSPADWEVITDPVFLHGHIVLMVLKTNLEISIATGMTHLMNFEEAWTEVFPGRRATSQWLDMLWNGRPVRRELRVLVDGARCGLPAPFPRGQMFVPERKVQLFKLIDVILGGHHFERYFEQAGMDTVAKSWP